MPAPSVLLVMRRGPGRGSVATTLRDQGFEVRRAENPFEATGDHAQRPADLIVVDLDVLASSGRGFVSTLRQRSRETGILLLMGPEDRRRALRALVEGADAYVLKPWYPEELGVLARRLVGRARSAPGARSKAGEAGAPASRALQRLADEVAHAVNNPLQVLSLHVEGLPVPPEARRLLEGELGRIRDVVRGLSRHVEGSGVAGSSPAAPPGPRPATPSGPIPSSASGHSPRSSPAPVAVGALLRRALGDAEAAGRIRPGGRPPADGPVLVLPAEGVRSALASMIDLLASRSGEAPARLTGRVRTVRSGDGRHVEAVLEADGARIHPEEVADLREHLLVTDDATRRSSSGLAVAQAVAEDLGGRLLLRPGVRGSVLALRIPLPPA